MPSPYDTQRLLDRAKISGELICFDGFIYRIVGARLESLYPDQPRAQDTAEYQRMARFLATAPRE